MHNRIVLVVVLIATTATAVHAQRDPIERWNLKLAESAKHLEDGQHAVALKIVERVVHEMYGKLGKGEGAARAFGIAVSYKAVALAGLGREEDALWYWQTALALYPPLAERDLSAFGEAGAFLATHRQPPQALKHAETPTIDAPKIEAPKVLRRAEPVFPAGARTLGATGNLVLEVLITKDGKVTTPRIVEALAAPTMSYAFLEALRKWKFEPGRLNGEPVETTFTMTASFSPSR
jgi:TonB family protein